jgi:hypothetical protein
MGFLDKAKAAAEQAAQKAKEGAELAAHKAKETAEDVQTKRELSGVYDELGHKAFELVESGAVANDALTPLVSRIKELQAKLDGAGEAAPAGGEAGTPA